MDRPVFIYGLLDARGSLCYVGQTRRPLDRELAHNGKTNAVAVVRAHAEAGGKPFRMVILEVVSVGERKWRLAERRWIEAARKRGAILNRSPGSLLCPDKLHDVAPGPRPGTGPVGRMGWRRTWTP